MVEDQVAKTVGDETFLVDLEALQHVRVVADHQVGAGVDGGVGDRRLQARVGIVLVLDAPVVADDHVVDLLGELADGALHARHVEARGRYAGAGRGHIARPDDVCPGEEADRRALLGLADRRLPGVGVVLAGADDFDAALPDTFDRVDEGGGAVVEGVVVAHGHYVEAGFAKGGGEQRRALEVHVLARPRAPHGGQR